MGVPKNFHRDVNLPKMAEALTDLNFYDFDYSVELSDEYNKKLREAEILGHIIETDLEVFSRNGDLELNCKKSFSALDDESAVSKIKEWLDTKVDKKEIGSYKINSYSSNTFYEELEERSLDKLFIKEEKGTN
jgi:hypothetical protein